MEYNLELSDPHQFEYGTPEDDLLNTESPTTMPTTYVIAQIQEKNEEIEKLKISLEECNVLD